jgi:hypothetical protein
MTLTRREHWATRSYHSFLLSRAKTDFKWGENDCALFAADGIEAMTGVDIAAAFRGQYRDEASAMEAIKRIAGGATIGDAAAWCAEQHGLIELKFPLMAQRGDLVVFENGPNLISGLVHLSGRHLVAVGENGLYRFSISSTKRAWRVAGAPNV